MLPYCPVNCFVLTQCNYFLPPSLYYVSTYCYAMIIQDTGECELSYHVHSMEPSLLLIKQLLSDL